MMTRYCCILSVALGGILAGGLGAQQVISARSGLVHYVEGQVYVNDKAIEPKFGEYPDIKVNQHLRTDLGRAEVLLTPGIFLRMAEESEIVMLSNQLSETRLEVLKGSAVLEVVEISKEQSIELLVSGAVVEPRKRGVFRIDAGDPSKIRSYDGEVIVAKNGQTLTLKEGREVELASEVPVATKFKTTDTDSFFRWAGRRSGYISMANASSARQMYNDSVPWNNAGWYYNPFFGMYTFIPLRGHYRNLWRYSYYSPSTFTPAASMPNPNPHGMDPFAGMNTMRGASDMSGRSYSGMSGGGMSQAPATATAPAAGAAVGGGRGADGGGSRGGHSGGR